MTEDSENLVIIYAAIFYGRGQQYKVGKRNMGSVKKDDRFLHEMVYVAISRSETDFNHWSVTLDPSFFLQ